MQKNLPRYHCGKYVFKPLLHIQDFKSETGEAPIRHLINIRLQKALELLQKEGYTNIKEVAAAVGYDDAYHFSKLFKKHFGFPPSQAKKSINL